MSKKSDGHRFHFLKYLNSVGHPLRQNGIGIHMKNWGRQLNSSGQRRQVRAGKFQEHENEEEDKKADSVISTAIVWDYSETNVLLLTNYHTWVTEEFRPFFPPLMKARKTKSDSDEEDDNVAKVTLYLCDSMGNTILEFDLDFSRFTHCHKEYDFVILSLPRENFNMPRIPITLVGVDLTLKIHALGFMGHNGKYSITDGIVSSIIPGGFTMNSLSAQGFSGAAILADVQGRAVGYMGGNLDSSTAKNSQHQFYAFKFDDVAIATRRQDAPPSCAWPSKKRTKSSSSGK